LTNNISNSSTPGFKAMKLQNHLHYTGFKHKLLQRTMSTLLQKIDAEKKTNGNNVDSQEQIRH
jgi:flagellar basal body rod protein FlgB